MFERPLKTCSFLTVISLFLCLTPKCYSISPSYQPEGKGKKEIPWFTGPIVTTSARLVPYGHFTIEPYYYWTQFPGVYGKHWEQISKPNFYEHTIQVVYKIGIAKKVNLSGIVQGFYSWSQGHSATTFGDLPIGFDFELHNKDNRFLKFSVQETFPTGRYQKLNPKKLLTDAGGAGSYVTQFSITGGSLHHFKGHNFLSLRLNLAANFPSPVHVKGANTYGGDPTTRGTVHPGIGFTFSGGAEYSLTRNWALAMDIVGVYAAKTGFNGHTILPVGGPSSVQYSAAPAIEYNWSEALGLIVGSWFTVAGRNSFRFINAVAALNYNY